MRFVAFSLFVALEMAACGSNSDSGGSPTATGGGSGVGGANTGGSAGMPTPVSGNGTISLSSRAYQYNGGPASISSVAASFVGDPPPGSGSNCTQSTLGACVVSSCSQMPVDCLMPGCSSPNLASAGVITVTGGSTTITLPDPTNGRYTPYQNAMATFFAGGETLLASASGSVVPAFATMVTAPSKVTITAPTPMVMGIQSLLTIDRARDLALSWTGGGAGNLTVSLVGDASVGGGSLTQAVCTFAAAAGNGTITAQALALFPMNGNGSFTVTPINSAMATAGAWHIDVVATGSAVASDGTLYTGTVTFQ